MSGTVVLTRPPGQAGALAARLQALGAEVLLMPVFAITPLDDPAPIAHAWTNIGEFDLVHFASANAIAHFFARRPPHAAFKTDATIAVMGPGSRSALAPWLQGACVDVITPGAERGDALPEALDSETLLDTLHARFPAGLSGMRVLLVKGEGGRDWLAQALAGAGARVEAVSVYRRSCAAMAPSLQTRLEALDACTDAFACVVTSSEGAQNLAAMLNGHQALAASFRAAPLIVTHARVAARARALGFTHVLECAPHDDAVIATLESAGLSFQPIHD